MRISPEVEVAFSLATREAARRKQEYVTLEHLLYALFFDAETAAAVRHAGGDIAVAKARLASYLDNDVERVEGDAQPSLSLGFQRVVGRAAMHVQTSNKDELKGVNVLVAMFAERDCPAVAILAELGITRFDIVNYSSHGISKGAEPQPLSAAEPEPSPVLAEIRGAPLLQAMVWLAGREAARRRHPAATVAHLLDALLLTDEAAQQVRNAGGDVAALRQRLEQHLDNGIERAPIERAAIAPSQEAPLSARANACLTAAAVATVARMGLDATLSVSDVLKAISEEPDGPAAAILRELGLRL